MDALHKHSKKEWTYIDFINKYNRSGVIYFVKTSCKQECCKSIKVQGTPVNNRPFKVVVLYKLYTVESQPCQITHN